jgi:hypothetical protein
VHTVSAMDIRLKLHQPRVAAVVSSERKLTYEPECADDFVVCVSSLLAASHCVPSSRGEDCTECNQSLINQKLEMENMKTKSKLESLKLVMQQKKERREARKLKLSPYNTQHSQAASASPTLTAQTVVPVPLVSASSNSINGGASHNRSALNGGGDGASATISASISSENHLEEVETVA